MRNRGLGIALAGLSCVAIASGWPWAEEVFAVRLQAYLTSAAVPDFQLRMTALLGSMTGEAPALSILSLLAWVLGAVACASAPWARHYLPLFFHPAAALLAVTGYGLAAGSILLLFISYERVLAIRTPAVVPALGVAYLMAALAVPNFSSLLIVLIAPLFALAPRVMLERHMVSFYLVTVLPAASATLLLHLSGPAAPPPLVPTFQAGGMFPLLLLAPAVPLAANSEAMKRLLFVLCVVSFGVVMTDSLPLAFRMLVTALAASFAMHQRTSLMSQLGGAAGVALAVAVFSADMG